jgi:hypothetical protein
MAARSAGRLDRGAEPGPFGPEDLNIPNGLGYYGPRRLRASALNAKPGQLAGVPRRDRAHGGRHGGQREDRDRGGGPRGVTPGRAAEGGPDRLDLAAGGVAICRGLRPELLEVAPDAAVLIVTNPVPLEYSIEWLTCAVASRLDAVMVG